MAGRIRTTGSSVGRQRTALRVDIDVIVKENVARLSDAAWRKMFTAWALSTGAPKITAPRFDHATNELASAGLANQLDGDGWELVAPADHDGCPMLNVVRATWSKRAYSEVYGRDGNQCRYCRAKICLSVDHVVPRCLGGSDEAENLVVACRSCNSKKNGRTPAQAGMHLLPVSEVTHA